MAQKAPILLHQEAHNTLISAINYYMQQGVPAYELKQIMDTLNVDLSKIIEQELTIARDEYNKAIEEETKAATKEEAIEKAE